MTSSVCALPGLKSIILLILSFVFHINEINAQVINTDRPDQTESSLVIPEGSFQIESGVMMTGYRGHDVHFLLPTNLIRVNVLKGIELRFLNQIEAIRSSFDDHNRYYFSDMEVGTKIQLFNREGSKTSASFLGHVIFPTGNVSVSREDYEFFAKLCLNHQLTEDWSFGYNLGINFASPVADSEEYTYSLVFAKSVTDKMGFFVEGYGEFKQIGDPERLEIFPKANAGMTYLLRDNIQLDFSFGTGLKETMNFISGGVSWNIAPKN